VSRDAVSGRGTHNADAISLLSTKFICCIYVSTTNDELRKDNHSSPATRVNASCVVLGTCEAVDKYM
jgi:hypothetical protein